MRSQLEAGEHSSQARNRALSPVVAMAGSATARRRDDKIANGNWRITASVPRDLA